MIVHIVIDDSKDVLKKASEIYKTFLDFEAAITHAKSCGYDMGWMRPSPEVGIRNNYMCGDKNISIINVEVIP